MVQFKDHYVGHRITNWESLVYEAFFTHRFLMFFIFLLQTNMVFLFFYFYIRVIVTKCNNTCKKLHGFCTIKTKAFR